jgi:2-succinyl-5-enolpyruvyl-6-hydroxy-3-cyclohexene-1-carboxylate synthase
MRVSNKTAVQSILFLLQERGIRHIVYSPGSRNAPFAIALDGNEQFEVHVKVDERSAGFFALGMAQQLKQPVVLICTSGTAPLNYAPAIAEAFYQEIPLVVITADRPAESINQSEGQCIDQVGIYANFIKHQCSLLEEATSAESIALNHQSISNALNQSMMFPLGPVHLNVPFKEPLYLESDALHPLTQMTTEQRINHSSEIHVEFRHDQNYLVLVGQNNDEQIAPWIEKMVKMPNILVLTETHSNAHALGAIDCIDRWIMALTPAQLDALNWDVVISLGHNIISRKIRALIKTKAKAHWSVQWQLTPIDTYRLNPIVFQCSVREFLSQWSEKMTFSGAQGNNHQGAIPSHAELVAYFQSRPYSDIQFFFNLSSAWPRGAQIQMGNSSIVRYIQLFEQRRDLRFFGNRGVSGIDGSTSTAMGAATVFPGPMVFVSGDLSFLYDANGLWHAPWPEHLKVIVVDNGGGGIFKIIEGARNEPSVPRFFETPHQRDIVQWVSGWGLTAKEVQEPTCSDLVNFFENNSEQILVVKTPGHLNPIELDLFFEYFKQYNERVEND